MCLSKLAKLLNLPRNILWPMSPRLYATARPKMKKNYHKRLTD